MRDSFIFYKSFYESIKELDPKDQVQIYNAIFEYEFYKKIPNLKGVCKSIFTLILPQLEANDKKYENGKKGGRPKTKTKPKNNQNKTKLKPNVNDNDNVNVNDNENDNVNVIYNNWNDNVICDSITNTNNKCTRRSTYNINNKNYCNQHSKAILKNYFNEEEPKEKLFEYDWINEEE